MQKGKVVLIGGTKRAGKTTLSMIMHKKYGFNYLNFDHIEDAIDTGINKLTDNWNGGEYFLSFLNQMIEFSIDDAENYGTNTIIDTYAYLPKLVSKLESSSQIEVYYLANLDTNESELRESLKKYSMSYDWPSFATEEQFETNIQDIIVMNKVLKEECKTYGYPLINTSSGENRMTALNNLADYISKPRSIKEIDSESVKL